MPQLGPLNWLFLFILFWTLILITTSLVWWMSPQTFYFQDSSTKMKKSHLWSW